METVHKDPDAVLPYGWDWANFGDNDGSSTDCGWLQSDTIDTSSWSITGPDAILVVDSISKSTTETGVVLSSGTAKEEYVVTNHIKTVAGYEDDRSILVKVAQK